MLSKWYFDTVHVPANNLFGILDDLDRKNHHHKADTVDEEGVKIELPGVKVCDINIDISDRSLRVSGKSRHGKEFHYAYGLGPEIDSDLISAKFQDGLLSVTLPKKKSKEMIRKVVIET